VKYNETTRKRLVQNGEAPREGKQAKWGGVEGRNTGTKQKLKKTTNLQKVKREKSSWTGEKKKQFTGTLVRKLGEKASGIIGGVKKRFTGIKLKKRGIGVKTKHKTHNHDKNQEQSKKTQKQTKKMSCENAKAL